MHMNQIRTRTHRTIRLAATVLLTGLIGIGVLIPQAAAQFGCLHACCTIPAGSHTQHDTVRISGPSHPSCCAMKTSDACQLCKFDKTPSVELAFQTVHSPYNQSTTGVSAVLRIPLSNAATQIARNLEATAFERGSPPLYLQTRTLLI